MKKVTPQHGSGQAGYRPSALRLRLEEVQGTVLILFTFYFLLFTLPVPVHAQSPIPIGEKFGFGDITSLGQGTSKLVNPIFSVTAALVILYFLFGAFKYIKAGGNKEEMAGARQMISHAIIGFIILMFAFLVLQFLLSKLFGTTSLPIIKTP